MWTYVLKEEKKLSWNFELRNEQSIKYIRDVEYERKKRSTFSIYACIYISTRHFLNLISRLIFGINELWTYVLKEEEKLSWNIHISNR